MDNKPRYQAVEDHEEIHSKDLIRDVRPLWLKIYSSLESRQVSTVFIIGCAAASIILPGLALFLFLLGLFAFKKRRRARRYIEKHVRLPFRLPMSAEHTDPSDADPSVDNPVWPDEYAFRKPSGAYFLGNERGSGKELWVKIEDMLTHMLLFGTTGSGKTETLVSIAFNALALGGGLIYIDPKAAPKLAFQIYRLARRVGRDDDFLVLNYSAAGKPGGPSPIRLTNTMNPLAIGSAEILTQAMISLLPPSEGGNSIFQNNAQALMSGVMYASVDLRDKNELELDVESLRNIIGSAAELVKLTKHPALGERAKASLEAALMVVGWEAGKPLGQQSKSFPEQLQYAKAYFGQPLSMLTDTYSHIYKTRAGEVDMKDVIMSRRVLVVLLPSLEKSPQELSNLGKLVLSSLRGAVATGLGKYIEGTSEDILEALPVDARVPITSIIDEYAAITTEGLTELLTQGRGLGLSAIVSSQDFAGIQEADSKGAQQMTANTKVKGFMLQEDAGKTMDLAKSLADEAYVMQTSGQRVDYERGKTSYKDKMEANAHALKRISFRDLNTQIEGQVHFFFRGRIVRAATFYANPPLKKSRLRINRFVQVATPNVKHLDSQVKGIVEFMKRAVENGGELSMSRDLVEFTRDTFMDARMPFAEPCGMTPMDRAICAVCSFANQSDQICEDVEKQALKELEKRDGEVKTNKVLTEPPELNIKKSEDPPKTVQEEEAAKTPEVEKERKSLGTVSSEQLPGMGAPVVEKGVEAEMKGLSKDEIEMFKATGALDYLKDEEREAEGESCAPATPGASPEDGVESMRREIKEENSIENLPGMNKDAEEKAEWEHVSKNLSDVVVDEAMEKDLVEIETLAWGRDDERLNQAIGNQVADIREELQYPEKPTPPTDEKSIRDTRDAVSALEEQLKAFRPSGM